MLFAEEKRWTQRDKPKPKVELTRDFNDTMDHIIRAILKSEIGAAAALCYNR